MASDYIKEKQPALVAICFDSPDHTGHTEGHDTPAYYTKLAELDTYIGQIVQAVKDAGILDDTIFILTADHGGIDKGHGYKHDAIRCSFYNSIYFQSRTTTSLDRQTNETGFQIITLKLYNSGTDYADYTVSGNMII